MRIGNEAFAFDPFGSTTMLRGTVDRDRLQGELSRIGGNHQKLSITFSGRASPGPADTQVIEGVLTSATCTWDVRLTRG